MPKRYEGPEGAPAGAPLDPMLDMDLAGAEDGMLVDSEMEEVALRAFPDLEEEPERLAALIELLQMIGGV